MWTVFSKTVKVQMMIIRSAVARASWKQKSHANIVWPPLEDVCIYHLRGIYKCIAMCCIGRTQPHRTGHIDKAPATLYTLID